jgi:hypothetical protein
MGGTARVTFVTLTDRGGAARLEVPPAKISRGFHAAVRAAGRRADPPGKPAGAHRPVLVWSAGDATLEIRPADCAAVLFPELGWIPKSTCGGPLESINAAT